MTHYLFLPCIALIVVGVAGFSISVALIVAGTLMAVWLYNKPLTGGDDGETRR